MTNESHKRRLSTWLLNPAIYVAGGKALAIGIGSILITSWIGSLSRTHFDGVLDVHTGMNAPKSFFIAEGIIDWLSVAIVFWIAGKIVARTSFRLIDLAGTQALARVPMIASALFPLVPGFNRFSQDLINALENKQSPDFMKLDAIWFIAGIVVMIIALCWMVTLMYRSYAHVSNTRGGRAVWSFVLALILAEIISKVAIITLLSQIVMKNP